MKNQFGYIAKSFKAEWLKIKGLELILIGVIVASITPILSFVIKIFVEESRVHKGFPTSIFSKNILQSYQGFGSFLLILFIIIIAVRITQSDHKNNGWTFMETQPLSKFSIYSGKFLAVLLLATISIVCYYIMSISFAGLTQVIFPDNNLYFSFDWGLILHSFLRMWILSLSIVSLQLMLSMIFSSFIWPFVFGFMGFAVNILGLIRLERYDFIPYNVTNTGLSITDPNVLNSYFNYTEYLTIYWAVVYFIIGYVIYNSKSIKNAFFNSTKKIAFTVLGLLIIIGGYYLLTQPIYTHRDDKITVIEGIVDTKLETNKVTIYKKELHQKVAAIPVVDGKFKWKTTESMPFAEYVININNRRRNIFLSTGDSIHLEVKISDFDSDFLFKGTRKATAHYLANADIGVNSSFFDYIIMNKMHTDDPKKFYDLAEKEWQNRIKYINNYRTKENIYLPEDFKTYMKQQYALYILNSINTYQNNTSFTDEEFAPPKEFENTLLDAIATPMEALYTSEHYKNWKMNQLLPKEGTDAPDSIIMAKLKEMPSGKEKDRLLSYQMVKILKLTEEDSTRTNFFKENSVEFKHDEYKNYVARELSIMNSQQKGSVVPHFTVKDNNDKSIDLLEKYKGKFIVIDWWATWCKPCLEIRPSYEYQAKRYSRGDVVFVSISADENKRAWELDIKNNKSKVKQYYLEDRTILGKLGVNAFPRFMIIDPNGKMYNSDLARPGESNFLEAMNEIRKK